MPEGRRYAVQHKKIEKPGPRGAVGPYYSCHLHMAPRPWSGGRTRVRKV